MEYCKNCVSEDCELINASERRARIFCAKKISSRRAGRYTKTGISI